MDLLNVPAISLIAVMLLHAGLSKLRAGDVVATVVRYDVLPIRVASRLAPLLPWCELLLGLMLVLGIASRYAMASAGLLFGVFAAGVLANLLRGRAIDCGCSGRKRVITWSLFWEDIALAAVCVTVVLVGQPVGLMQAVVTGAEVPSRTVGLLGVLLALSAVLTYSIWQTARALSDRLPTRTPVSEAVNT